MIENLKTTVIEDTEIEEISYENSGEFKDSGGGIYGDLPSFHRVRLLSKPGVGSHIYTEVWLPDNWNGIFIGTGNGGMAGNISYWALADYVRKGYAVANTDMGTSKGRNFGINNPDVWKDFGWRATHIMTVAAKALILKHYGKNPDYAYFTGASTGGEQALAEAQRFPEDYDGIIAGVPANNRTMLHTYFLWNHIHLRPKNSQPLFGDEEIQSVTDCAVEFFQSMGDGIKGDNFISLPVSGEKIVNDFIDFIKEKNKFSEAQLDALRAVYTGPVDPNTGERIYNGMPVGSEIYGCGISECQGEESPHYYPFIWVFGKDYDGYSFDFDKDMDTINEKLAADMNANSADLSKFMERGGKLLMYSGSADPCVPFPDAVNYYSRVYEKFGDKTKDFLRYFILPGRDHGNMGNGTNSMCQNGDLTKTDMDIIRAWREEDKAPKSVTAVGYNNKNPEDGVRFMREVYPYDADKTVFSLGDNLPVCSDIYLK